MDIIESIQNLCFLQSVRMSRRIWTSLPKAHLIPFMLHLSFSRSSFKSFNTLLATWVTYKLIQICIRKWLMTSSSHIQVIRMDEFFEASFSSLANAAPKFRSKCGKCRRYMKCLALKYANPSPFFFLLWSINVFLSIYRPVRLYCETCEETYSLPQNGNIKLNQTLECPLDNFELLLCKIGTKTFSLCPYCYNHPTLEGMEPGMGNNHPLIPYSINQSHFDTSLPPPS